VIEDNPDLPMVSANNLEIEGYEWKVARMHEGLSRAAHGEAPPTSSCST